MVLLRRNKQRSAGVRTESLRPLDVSLGHTGALDFQASVLRCRWTQAGRIFTNHSDWNDRNLLLSTLADLPGRRDVFDRWIWEQPHNPLAHLARGAHGVRWAWQAKEDAEPGTDATDRFYERLRGAEQDLDTSVRMEDNPLSWSWLIRSGRGLGISTEELALRFRRCQQAAPGLWHAHHQLLMGLSSRWGGNDEAMLRFARLASDAAPAGSPLHDLVAIAQLECWISAGRPAADSWFVGEVRSEIIEASRRSVFDAAFSDRAAFAPGIRAQNAFAVLCHLCGELRRTSSLLQSIGNRVTGFPWNHSGADPMEAHAAVVADVNRRLLNLG